MDIKDIFMFLLSVFAFLWCCILLLTGWAIVVDKVKKFLKK